ncbi:d-tyrosyl-trna(tyr) deacylase [hydrocarbon metagenome]|uniref:D-tyrosyl-trna(Tyr) deacylase n=1 Tax=hydrocarbon metagenome TaxID=938273 RepID=A0A0W8E565_9ZZZZ
MRAVIQRTIASKVTVEDEITGEIQKGSMVLLGIKRGDTEKEAEYLMDKIVHLRIFPDEEGKMNRSLIDVGGEILLVSQFTLYGDARKGRRPGFSDAALPELARPLFEYCVKYLQDLGIKVATGIFGAEMVVRIDNDGPVTILLDSEKVF